MLHFCPIEPTGQVVSVPPSTVHFCEHTGVGNMLNELVHTPLAHSVLVSLTVVQSEPKASPEPIIAASGVLVPPLVQATATETDNAIATRKALRIS